MLIGGSVKIIVELNEKEDPIESMSTMEDLFPEIK
jgi:hypothetical protein